MSMLDKDYLARREKQIQELYELRAMIGACFVTGVLLALGSVGLLAAGYNTAGVVLMVIASLFGMGAIFMVASYFGQKAADRAIQEEFERLVLTSEKPKRGSQSERIRPSDDGELDLGSDLMDEALTWSGQDES